MAFSIEAVAQGVLIGGLVGCASAFLTSYVTGKIHDVKINEIRECLKRMEGEIKTIRVRLHEWAPHIGWVEQQRRYHGVGKRMYDNGEDKTHD